MKSKNRVRAIIIATALATPSCSLLLDAEGLSGGAVNTNEGGVAEASDDHVSPPTDAPTTAISDADAAAPSGPYCQTLIIPPPGVRLFCEDFDNEDASAAETSFSTGNGKVSIENKKLRVQIDPLDGGNSAILPVRRALNVVPKRIHVSFDFTVTKNKAFLNLVALAFKLTSPTRTGVITFQLASDGFRMVEQVDFGTSDDFRAHSLTTRVWPTSVPIHVDYTWRDNFTFDLLVDGVTYAKDRALFPSWGKGLVTLEYGVSYANGFGDTDVTIDSLSIEGEL